MGPVNDGRKRSIASICESRVKAMDETPIKAGRVGPGKMKAGYFWPVDGEHDEVCFPYFESRRAHHVERALRLKPAESAVLRSDGYTAYAHYAAKTGITLAQCWAHARRVLRRLLFEAQGLLPSNPRPKPESDDAGSRSISATLMCPSTRIIWNVPYARLPATLGRRMSLRPPGSGCHS